MAPQKNQQDKNAQGFQKEKRGPQHVKFGFNKFPLQHRAYGKIDGIPQTYKQVGALPDSGYCIKPFHGKGKIVL